MSDGGEAPLLETMRLRLRGHRAADLDPLAAMWAEPEVVRYIGGRPSTRPQVWSRIAGYVGHWRLLGFGYWVVEERATGSVIGEAGFADYMRGIDARLEDTPELGFAFASHAHGKGYATEAVAAIVAWSDTNFVAPRTVCIVSEANVASRRVVERAGYRVFAGITHHEQPTLLMERLRLAS